MTSSIENQINQIDKQINNFQAWYTSTVEGFSVSVDTTLEGKKANEMDAKMMKMLLELVQLLKSLPKAGVKGDSQENGDEQKLATILNSLINDLPFLDSGIQKGIDSRNGVDEDKSQKIGVDENEFHNSFSALQNILNQLLSVTQQSPTPDLGTKGQATPTMSLGSLG